MKTFKKFLENHQDESGITNSEEETIPYRIYCDLDGVLVDLNKGIADATGVVGTSKGVDLRAIVHLRKSGHSISDFFSNLDWTPDGKNLWNFLRPYNPWILTGGSDGNDVTNGKIDWCRKNLNIDLNKIIVDSNKSRYASSNAILIDDYYKNVNDFRQAGGIGIIHLNSANSIDQLKEYF